MQIGHQTFHWNLQLLQAQQFCLVRVVGTKVLVAVTDISFVHTTGFFTLVIGRVFQVETLGLVKIGAVMLR